MPTCGRCSHSTSRSPPNIWSSRPRWSSSNRERCCHPIPQEFAGDEDETPEQVEERLRRRLIAYSKYRELGERLRTFALEASGYFYREAGDPASQVVQRYHIDPEKLKHAFVAMLNQARPEKRSIARERVSLIASMDYITRRVKEFGEVTFSGLCHELGMTREVVIVTFLALLELVRRRRVSCEQPELFDDIRIVPMVRQQAVGA